MIVRTKEIIELQNELDELIKFKATNFSNGRRYNSKRGVLLEDTINEKEFELAELYEKQMKLYLKKRGVSYDTETKWYDFRTFKRTW